MHRINTFEVSVVIPVYNAEKYVERAILSALQQPEVREVIVVDDGYQDGALEICRRVAASDTRVKVLQHPNGENRGAGATRNYGILHAGCEYIAFLDADDYYLPDRFKLTAETFLSDPKVDAVYEPVGVEYTSANAKEKFMRMKRRATYGDPDKFLSYPIEPFQGEELFLSLIKGKNDGPHTDGITIKKSLLSLAGLFNPSLKLHQDTEFWTRASYYGQFANTGRHDIPVSVRTMHDENRTYSHNVLTKLQLQRTIVSWMSQANIRQELFVIALTNLQALTQQVEDLKAASANH